MKLRLPGRNPRPADVPVWVTLVASGLLTCSVVAAFVALHVWSDHKQASSQAVGVLRTDIAVEQESVNDSVSMRALLQVAAQRAVRDIQSLDVPDAALAHITRLSDDYQAAVTAELNGMRIADMEIPAVLNALMVDQRFAPLDAALASESREEEASAAGGVAVAFAATIAMVVAAGLLICSFALFARRRRSRIVAAQTVADRLAEDARVLATREETFRSLFDDSPQPMLVTRLPAQTWEAGDLQFLAVNRAAVAMYGYTRQEFLALTLDQIRPQEDCAQLFSNLLAVRGGRTHFEDIHHRTKAGDVLDIEVDTQQLMYDGEPAMIVCPNDVTDRVRLQRELEHQAFHDELTGLPNRSLFHDRLQHAHQRLESSGGCYAVLMVDLDNFKMVNDSLGHAVGDDLLVRVAERLVANIGSGDTAARLGGDEFEILLEDLGAPCDAAGAAERLRVALRAPFIVAGRTMSITATIGVATSIDAKIATDVVRNADVALYVGKADGKDRHAVFTDTMHVDALERMTLEQDLRAGIGRGELTLLYQPKVDAQTSALTGVEALVRWNHPSRGLMAPDVFIPIAEQSGLINELDTWVLMTACRQAQSWATSNAGPLPVAVNVSGRSLVSCRLLERVIDALDVTGLDPHLLELEITESAAVPQQGEALALLQTVRDLGVRIAIDDFGSGYSVLSRLQRFPVDTLKIDLSFTRAIVSAEQDAPIIDAMIAMGLSLGLTVVAEGVETEAQRHYLSSRHCSQLQGYLISRPIAPLEVVARFRTPQRAPALLAARRS
ncbi:MAG: bifunctional diguanylate cyclase/phosphodiesterase [Candidatus Dormiibacterota bacterium]